MTREEQIEHKAGVLADFGIANNQPNQDQYYEGFKDGAKWADEHPKEPPLPSNLDEVARKYAHENAYIGWDYDRTYDAFKAGAEWMAEKDLALTPDDVWCIFNLVRELQVNYSSTQGCLQEVADVFNEKRKEK